MFATEWSIGTEKAGDALLVRETVFIKELGLSKKTVFDEGDAFCAHLLVRVEEKPIASGRLLPEAMDVRMEHCCVLKEMRGQGFFDLMIRTMLFRASHIGAKKIWANVPENFFKYFSAFGFQKTAEKSQDGLLSLWVEPEQILWHSPCKNKNEDEG